MSWRAVPLRLKCSKKMLNQQLLAFLEERLPPPLDGLFRARLERPCLGQLRPAAVVVLLGHEREDVGPARDRRRPRGGEHACYARAVHGNGTDCVARAAGGRQEGRRLVQAERGGGGSKRRAGLTVPGGCILQCGPKRELPRGHDGRVLPLGPPGQGGPPFSSCLQIGSSHTWTPLCATSSK